MLYCYLALSRQKLPQRPRHVLERLVELARLLPARLREVGLAAALAADDRSELAEERRGGDALDEVLRHGGQQRHLAVADAAEHHHPALDLRAHLVREVAEVAAADVVDAARHELHAVHVARRLGRRRRAAAAASPH